MALLSDVTHMRLEERRAWSEETTATKGIRNIGGFDGCVRCCEVVRSPEEYFVGTDVWSSEQTGEVTVRRGATGQPLLAIERKKDVYVLCMLSYGGFMWCGLSDGYLRIFDELTYELAFEVKQHAGAVTCMVALDGYIFTGSRDWQILQWDAVTFRYMVQLSGHQNTVNCLAAEGHVLFSGGSDYAIRCWDLETMQEKAHPWPVIGHRGDVRALVIDEVFLFSASTDGTMKVWNTQTGQLVKFMDHRDGPIMTLMRDPTASRIWAGGVDGIVCVWDAQSLQLVTRMFDHAGTYVNCLQILARVNTMKVWSVAANGTVKVWMSEAAEADPQCQIASLRAEQELQQTVDHMRAAIIQNYEELERRKEQLRRIEMIDERRRFQLALALGGKSEAVLKRLFYSMTLRWMAQRRDYHQRKRVAHMMLSGTNTGLARLYYKKLQWYSQAIAEQRRKRFLCESIMASTEKGLMVVYWKKLQQQANYIDAVRKKRHMAHCLGMNVQRAATHVYYQLWVRWLCRRREHNRRVALAHSLLRSTDRGTLRLYYGKLQHHRMITKERKRKEMAAELLLGNTNRGLQLIFYRKMERFLDQCRNENKRLALCESLEGATGRALSALYYHRLEEWAANAETRMLERELAHIRSEAETLERILAQPVLSEEELRRAVIEADVEIMHIEEQTEALNDDTYELELQMADTRREMNNLRLQAYGGTLVSDSESEMAKEILSLLKGISVHCDHDFDRLTISRQEGKGQEQLLYDKGIRTVKRIIERENMKKGITKAEAFPPTGEWCIAKYDSGKILPKKALFNAVCGIREMVVAFDMMSYEMRSRMVHNQEVIINACSMIEMVLQCNKFRARGEIEVSEVKIKRRKRASSGRKRASSRKSSGKNSSKKSSQKKKKKTKEKKGSSSRNAPPSRAVTLSPDTMGGRIASRQSVLSKGSRGSQASKGSRGSRGSRSSSKQRSGSAQRRPAPGPAHRNHSSGSGRAPSPRPVVPRPTPRGASPRVGAPRGSTPRTFRAMSPRPLHAPRAVSPSTSRKPAAKRAGSPTVSRRPRGFSPPRARSPGVSSRAKSPGVSRAGRTSPRKKRSSVSPGPSVRARRSPSPRPRVGGSTPSPSRKKGMSRKRSTSTSKRRGRSRSGSRSPKKSVSPKGSKKKGSRRRSVSGKKSRSRSRSAKSAKGSSKAGKGRASPRRSMSSRRRTPLRGRKKRDPVKTPWLGMNIDVSARNERECRIDEVTPGGPAEYCGVVSEDLLTSFGGDVVTHVPSFQDAFAKHAKVGATVPFEVKRDDGSTHSGTFTVLSQRDKILLNS